MLGGLFRAEFLNRVEYRAHQNNCRNNDERSQIAGQSRDCRSGKKDEHQGVAKAADELQRERQTSPLLKDVGAKTNASSRRFGRSQSDGAAIKTALKLTYRKLPEFWLCYGIRPHS
jgi:hypothetical protein